MYILQDKHLFSDDEIESIMSPLTEEPKLLEEEKSYKTVTRGPIGIAIKNFWTLFGFFSNFLIAAIIVSFFLWCFWVRKKAEEKRRQLEYTRTIDSEESSGNSDLEDEEFSVGSGQADLGVVFGATIYGRGKNKRKKKKDKSKKKDKIKKTGNKKSKSQKVSKTNKSKIKSKTKGRK